MAWRCRDLLLVLNGNGNLNIDVFKDGPLLCELMVDFDGDGDINGCLTDNWNSELLEHIDLHWDLNVLLGDLLNGIFDLSFVHLDGRDLVLLLNLDDDWHLVCNSNVFERWLFVVLGNHFDLGDFDSDLLNVVLGHFALLLGDDDLGLGGADHGRGAAAGGVGTATADTADAATVSAEAATLAPVGLLSHEGVKLTDGDGDGLGDLLLDVLHLLDHTDGASLDGLESVLQDGLHFLNLVVDDLLDGFGLGSHLDLLDHLSLFDEAGFGLLHHLLLHHDLGNLLKFFAENSLLALDGLSLVLDSALALLLLLEHNPLDGLGHGADHLLLASDRFHLPLGALSGAVAVLFVDVAVLVAMELVGDVLDAAAATCSEGAAGARRYFAPEGAGLVVAASTAAGGAAGFLALTAGVGHSLVDQVDPGERAVLEFVSLVGFGPLGPSVLVVAADATHEGITDFQHEGGLLEVVDVGGELGHGAGDGGQVCENAIGTDALHLVLLDRGAGLALTPVHDRLVAVLVVGSHGQSVHGLGYGTALIGARGATDFVAEAGARSRAAFFVEGSSQLLGRIG